MPTLKTFQQEGVDFLRENDYRALLADAPGTGKTVQILTALANDRRKLTPMLVIAPASVTQNWQDEARVWAPWARTYVISDETTPIPSIRLDIIICSWGLLASRLRRLAKLRPKFLVVDEAPFAKNEEALRSRAIGLLAGLTPHRVFLTGTPIVNKEDELAVLRRLIGSENPPMLRRLLEDVTDLPPKSRKYVPVTMPERRAREYRKAADNFSEWLQDTLARRMSAGEAEEAARRALAAEALIRMNVLRHLAGVGKINATVAWTERAIRAGEPVVIFGDHTDVLDGIQRGLQRLRIGSVRIDGSTSHGNRALAIASFKRGDVPVFIGSRAAAEGITLTNARHLIFAERFWTPAAEEQCEGRIYRMTQKSPTSIWFIHAAGTVDERIREVIEAKRTLVRDVIGAADVEEDTVADVLKIWSRGQQEDDDADDEAILADLGHVGGFLPPLPAPRELHTFNFARRSWSKKDAVRWAKMHGYRPTGISETKAHVVLTNKPPRWFFPGTFTAIDVTNDIQAIVGKPRTRR